jgi:site-specific recombinase XerD
MSARQSLPERVEQYLAERRRLGFELRHKGQALGRFARYVEAVGHRGPLTVDLMVSWARQVKKGQGDRGTSARALRALRPFMRWLQQFEPATEVPDEAIFGPVPGRLTPHIFRDEEIEALLEAAGRIGPPLRGAVMQTLFGLIACTGLRISEALALVDADVDLKVGVLTVRCSKFGKSRLVPLHPSAVAALCTYRRERTKYLPADPEGPFFIATRGRRLGRGISDRQAHRIFDQLRQQLGWVSRGGHGAARIHDLRHSFAVRRLLRWHEQGADVHQHMLALSTYMGHAKVSNTYWYLTGVPELLQLVGRRFEHFVDLWEAEEDGDG